VVASETRAFCAVVDEIDIDEVGFVSGGLPLAARNGRENTDP
jgi:hypothetical protein